MRRHLVRLWRWLFRTDEAIARARMLYAEAERGIARPIRGMEAPDYDTIRRTRSVDLRDVAAIRRWRRRRSEQA